MLRVAVEKLDADQRKHYLAAGRPHGPAASRS
jgi:hypothetical protein